MALNPIVFTEKVVRSFLRYQLTAYPFSDEGLSVRCGGSFPWTRPGIALVEGAVCQRFQALPPRRIRGTTD